MKITIEFDSFDEFESFRAKAPAAIDQAQVKIEPSKPEPEPAPAKPKRKRRTKAEIEAEKAAARLPEPTPEPEPEPEPAAPVLAAVPDPEPVAGEPATIDLFKQLVTRDYDTAATMLNELGCETYGDVAENGKSAELRAMLLAHAS